MSSTPTGTAANIGQRVNQLLARMIVADSTARAVDIGRTNITHGTGGHGKHGATNATGRLADEPLAQQWARHLAHVLDAAEHDLAVVQGRERLQPRRMGSGSCAPAALAAERRRRILRLPLYRGRHDTFVGHVEGCSESFVRRVRAAAQLDPYGLRTERPLTASRPTTEAR